ncbi:hypothetical protein DERF_004476 [Dermatophagoides farinae]|uniref:Uncharacterized protein n=1 Tax=Dermatophagoides farinae TaxID=6954 RepID=A0A922I2G4_DERFA|nr:hypothetical protein DERF_004476 [Dermatophagoides farinae]
MKIIWFMNNRPSDRPVILPPDQTDNRPNTRFCNYQLNRILHNSSLIQMKIYARHIKLLPID